MDGTEASVPIFYHYTLAKHAVHRVQHSAYLQAVRFETMIFSSDYEACPIQCHFDDIFLASIFDFIAKNAGQYFSEHRRSKFCYAPKI